jgi:poly(A) polymerase
MTTSHNWLRKYPKDLVAAIIRTAEKQHSQVYIVGGTVRDLLLGILPQDLDLAVNKDGVSFTENLASLSGGTFVLLDADNGVGRVVWKGYVIDVAEFRDSAIEIDADLVKRDFTINAMAVPLVSQDEYPSSLDLIDPCHGQRDLQNSLIRSVYPSSFIDDPLRLLRAYRFASETGFAIEPQTEQLIRDQASLIKNVSSERVTYELNRIMASKRTGIVVQRLAENGLLWHLFPELKKGAGLEQPASHHLDVFDHNLATLSAMEGLHKSPEEYFPESEILHDYLADDKKRIWLKWAALFHDVGKPDALKIRNERITFYNHDRAGIEIISKIGHRFRWSNEDINGISRLVGNHMWPFHLSNVARSGQVSAKAILKLVKTIGDDLPGLFLLAMADSLAGQGSGRPPKIEKELADLFVQVDDVVKNQVQPVLTGPKLVTGQDLIDIGLTPGPVFRELLEEVEKAQVSGDISDRADALKIIEGIIRERRSLV